MQNKVIEIRLNEYAPIKDSVCKTSDDHDHVYEIKFHGKPVNILPLKNSNIEKDKEKNKIKIYQNRSITQPKLYRQIYKGPEKQISGEHDR